MERKRELNAFKFANNPELWEETKIWLLKGNKILQKLKDFLEYHLTTNFKYLIPDKKCLDNIDNIREKLVANTGWDYYGNYKFELIFFFTDYKDLSNDNFKKRVEIKLKDKETKCKVLNKKELKQIFQKALFRAGYEAGYIQSMIGRIEIEIDFFRNDKERLGIKENIISDLPEKTQYESTLQRVKNNSNRNSELHRHYNYLCKRFDLIGDSNYINFLRKQIGHKNISYTALEKSLDRYRKR